MRLKVAIAERGHAIDPYKYYVWSKERIYIYNDLFAHVSNDSRYIFRPHDFPCELPIDDIIDFDESFHKMVHSELVDVRFEEDLEYIQQSTKPPIIIGGCGRSGTTLLLSVLGAHDNIYAFDEELYAFYPKPYRLNNISNAIDKYNVFKKRWCEKTPKNVQAFREIYNLFDGNVKLIHMIRDGRDVVTSSHPNHKYKKYWVDTERWIDDVTRGLDCADICYELKYEDLVINPESSLKNLCEFIDEPFDTSLLRHSASTTVRGNPAWDGKAEKIHTKRLGKWKNPEHADRIKAFLQNKDAHALMKRLQYI